jgi:hypothetical protein
LYKPFTLRGILISLFSALKRIWLDKNFKTILWWGLALGLVIGCSVNKFSGFDWYVCFAPQALQVDTNLILNPMWIYLILSPIAWLPTKLSFMVFLFLNILMIRLALYLSGTNRFALLLSFPALWLLWYGQLDGFVMLGVALGFWSLETHKPVITGFSILLLLVKPHIGIPLGIAYFLWSRNWKTLLVMLAVFALSCVFWGVEWPIYWVKNLLSAGEPWRMVQHANIGLFPYGLIAWLGLFIPMSRKDKVIYIVSATIASLNYVGTYSLLILLILQPPWWAFVLSAAPILLGQNGYWITSLVAPLVILWILLRNIGIEKASGKSALVFIKETIHQHKPKWAERLIKS